MPGPELSALLFALLIGGMSLFFGAIWFGLFVVAPWIRRALDRADTNEGEPGERPD